MGKRKWELVTGKKSVKKVRKEEEDEKKPELERKSDDPAPKKEKWINRQRTLAFASRGIPFRGRHLLLNFKSLLPHIKPDTKKDSKKNLSSINEICEMKNCNTCIYLEARKRKDLYLWLSDIPNGPCAKFLLENVHTMEELKLVGNCLKGSRPILSFDQTFEELPHAKLMKELFVKIFGTPRYHPKSQPFIDHIMTFTVIDNKIWFRNYQITEDNGDLIEIGPRFVMNPIKVFTGSFGGPTLWDNPHYVTPNVMRKKMKMKNSEKFVNRKKAKALFESKQGEKSYQIDPTNHIFKMINKK